MEGWGIGGRENIIDLHQSFNHHHLFLNLQGIMIIILKREEEGEGERERERDWGRREES